MKVELQPNTWGKHTHTNRHPEKRRVTLDTQSHFLVNEGRKRQPLTLIHSVLGLEQNWISGNCSTKTGLPRRGTGKQPKTHELPQVTKKERSPQQRICFCIYRTNLSSLQYHSLLLCPALTGRFRIFTLSPLAPTHLLSQKKKPGRNLSKLHY